MLNVKLIVFFFYIAVGACRDKYCEICLNHTLCKYAQQGPATKCKHYSISAMLSKNDVTDILNRINERRNFVALGQSRKLPQAANMRKVVWSDELATFAQRWADQCDPYYRPDREDQCRDLSNMAVGQNIATVLGPSPGLKVKSFIDLWYMQTLDYNGSVSYYNRSKDFKTNYFTQLIWAESDTVGCGRARFSDERGNTLIERLVCNFAVKGNTHGKPVYAIGFPATQCPDNRRTDEHYRGLCNIQNDRNKSTTQFSPASSLLRILISNNSVKQEIDPIRSNLKYIKFDANKTDSRRNQKIRHVMTNMMNNSYAGSKAFDHQSQMHLYNNPPSNFRRPGFRRFQQEERGHSRVYHDHEHKNHDILPFKSSSESDFRRYEFTTESVAQYPQNDLRKHNQFLQQCTRRAPMPLPMAPPLPAPLPLLPSPTAFQPMPRPMPTILPSPIGIPPPLPPLMPPPLIGGCYPPNPCCYNRCAKGPLPPPLPPPPCAYQPPPLIPAPLPPPPPPLPPLPPIDPCPYSPPCIPNAYCQTGCQCSYENIPPPLYPNIARSQDDMTIDETRKSGGLHYYDLLPNLAVRSGDTETEKAFNNKDTVTLNRKKWPISSTSFNKLIKSVSLSRKIKDSQENNAQINDPLPYYKNDHDHEYPYRSFESIERNKRQSEDENIRPFWQMDELNYKHPSQLKAMRYTTLPNKRNRNVKKNTARHTEPITISVHDSYHEEHEDHITEKFLSFDELMHLRKFNDEEDYGSLRQAKGNKNDKKSTAKATTQKKVTTPNKGKTTKTTKTTKKAATTTKQKTTKAASKNVETEATKSTPSGEYTTNTPFMRKKHCTRIMTCTWTIATVTAQDGSIYNQGGNVGGSRTPPGYVEGCTRTSTCTRVHLNRNKITQPSNDGRGSDGVSGGEGGEDGEGGINGDGDEDYCERRSLDVKKKSGDDDEVYVLTFRRQKAYTNAPLIYADAPIYTETPLTYIFSSTSSSLPYPMKMVSKHFVPTEATSTEKHDCFCYEGNDRKKREILSIQQDSYLSKKSNDFVRSCENVEIKKYPFSYGDLYFLVLKKIMQTSNRHRNAKHSKVCHCSGGAINQVGNSLLFLFLYFAVVN